MKALDNNVFLSHTQMKINLCFCTAIGCFTLHILRITYITETKYFSYKCMFCSMIHLQQKLIKNFNHAEMVHILTVTNFDIQNRPKCIKTKTHLTLQHNAT